MGKSLAMNLHVTSLEKQHGRLSCGYVVEKVLCYVNELTFILVIITLLWKDLW